MNWSASRLEKHLAWELIKENKGADPLITVATFPAYAVILFIANI